MPVNVTAWLNDLGLGQYASKFEENEIVFSILPDITDADLKELGINALGHRKLILKSVNALKEELSATVQTPEKTTKGELSIPAEIDDDVSAWSRTPGERKPVTMLFADIVGSTALTESLDAEEAHQLLYLATQHMCEAVEKCQGTVCRFMGDGIMAMFGAPIASERHALEACRAALEMQASIDSYSETLQSDDHIPIQIRVGLHSGEVVVLEVGDDPNKPEYDASGATVPLAARMEQTAAPGSVLITAATRLLAGEMIEVDAHPEVSVKGVSKPVIVHQLRGVVSAIESVAAGARYPFVGRRVELAQFQNLLETSRKSDHGQTVLVRGEAGIGKSRLVEEISQVARDQGLQQHKALVFDFGTGKGQETAPTLVKSLLGIVSGSGIEDCRAAIGRAEKSGIAKSDDRVFLNDLLGLTQPEDLRTLYDAMSVDTRSEGKKAILSGVVSRIASKQPLLLVVEDLHWSDNTTLDYLASLAAAVAQCSALLLMTTRVEGDPVGQAWRSRAGDNPILTWDLAPLRKEESISLVSGFINENDELAQRCIERAAGNPLFLEQLLLSVARDASENVPDSIKSLVLTRLDQLPIEDKRALQAAAVLGQRFELDSLHFLVESPDFECDNLVQHHLLRPDGSHYLFAHALIQEGTYASLLKTSRNELHQRAAEWFATKDPVLYAQHLDQAGAPTASDAYHLAACELFAQYEFNHALQLVRRGLEIVANSGHFALQCLEGELLRILDLVHESITSYREALELASDGVERCDALLGIAQGLRTIFWSSQGPKSAEAAAELAQILNDAEAIATPQNLKSKLAEINLRRGELHYHVGRSEECLQAYTASWNYAREAELPELEMWAVCGLGTSEFLRGRYVSAQRYYDQCDALACEHGLRNMISEVLGSRGWTFIWQNDMDSAATDINQSQQLAEGTGNSRALLWSLERLVCLYILKGDLVEAEEVTRRILTLAQLSGAENARSIVTYYIIKIKYYQKDKLGALKLAEEAVEKARKAVIEYWPSVLLGGLALTATDKQQCLTALSEGETSLAGSSSPNHFLFYEDAIEASLKIGDWNEAERFAQALQDYTQAEPLSRTNLVIDRARALIAHGCGNRDRATRDELQMIYDQAWQVGLRPTLPALKAALHSYGDSIPNEKC